MYSTNADVIKMLVGNKIDMDNRQVTKEEGVDFARQNNMLFIETSAKTRVGVQKAFEELCHKIIDTPSLSSQAGGRVAADKGLDLNAASESGNSGGYCC